MVLYFIDSLKNSTIRMCECRTEEEAFKFISTFVTEYLHATIYYYNIWGEVNNKEGKIIDFGSYSKFFNLKEE